jgi:hypothetical protein
MPTDIMVKLSQVLYHPTLFQYYPKLANMPILYLVADDDKNQGIQQVFYYSPNERGGYIMIQGSRLYGSVLSTLLHENAACYSANRGICHRR